jgi:hypothetical protein
MRRMFIRDECCFLSFQRLDGWKLSGRFLQAWNLVAHPVGIHASWLVELLFLLALSPVARNGSEVGREWAPRLIDQIDIPPFSPL